MLNILLSELHRHRSTVEVIRPSRLFCDVRFGFSLCLHSGTNLVVHPPINGPGPSKPKDKINDVIVTFLCLSSKVRVVKKNRFRGRDVKDLVIEVVHHTHALLDAEVVLELLRGGDCFQLLWGLCSWSVLGEQRSPDVLGVDPCSQYPNGSGGFKAIGKPRDRTSTPCLPGLLQREFPLEEQLTSSIICTTRSWVAVSPGRTVSRILRVLSWFVESGKNFRSSASCSNAA